MTTAGGVGPRWPHPLTGQLFESPVPPGQGWPGDPAGPTTPVAHTADDVARLGAAATDLDDVDRAVSVCRACPRLVEWRESVAVAKRKAFATQPYWGRPVTGWGEERPRVVVVGLAPAVHGGNRTGRIFTGDRSGDWLFAALHRAGLATQAASDHAGDGQQLVHTRMVAAVRCAPPDNKPSPAERDTCAPWFDAELRLVLPSTRVIVCLGGFAWAVLFGALARLDLAVPRPRAAFGHGARVTLGGSGASPEVVDILGCYHPSQQNTFTGRLTEGMLDDLFGTAVALAGLSGRR